MFTIKAQLFSIELTVDLRGRIQMDCLKRNLFKIVKLLLIADIIFGSTVTIFFVYHLLNREKYDRSQEEDTENFQKSVVINYAFTDNLIILPTIAIIYLVERKILIFGLYINIVKTSLISFVIIDSALFLTECTLNRSVEDKPKFWHKYLDKYWIQQLILFGFWFSIDLIIIFITISAKLLVREDLAAALNLSFGSLM